MSATRGQKVQSGMPWGLRKSAEQANRLTTESAGYSRLRWRISSPLEKGRGRVRGGVDELSVDLVNGDETFPPPALSPRRGRTMRRAGAKPVGLDSSRRGMRCSLSQREGQGEGERDAANQDGRANSASSTRPAPCVRVGYHRGRKACR